MHPHLFRSILGREPAISEYQVQQTRAGAEIIVCADGAVDVESLNHKLKRGTRALGMPRADRRRSQWSRASRDSATGKLKRFLAL